MPQFNFDRETALAVTDDLTPLGVNVTIIVVADPVQPNSATPVYQLELSRNASLDASKVADLADALVPHDMTVQFPSMNIVSTLPDPEPVPDASGGGAVADDATGALVEPPQAQPAAAPVDTTPTP